MNLLHAFVLGALQGLTEFIPISSTAHLLIAQEILRLPTGETTFAFLVIVQMGTLLSLLAHYWRDFATIVANMFSWKAMKTSTEARLGWYLIVATLPALLSGYLLHDAVESLFRMPLPEAAIRLFSAAFLLAWAEWMPKKSRPLNSLNWLDALLIGLFQVVAVFPGASRSGATISGGMLRGLTRPAAARFAFLMSVPVLAAAGGYELAGILRMPDVDAILPALLVGFLTASLTGWWAIRWLLRFLERHSLYGFASYCAGAGLLCALAWFMRWLVL